MDNGQAFDRTLRRLRKARGLTQEALAEQVCCALDTIKKLEAGRRRPSRHLALQLADVLALEGAERTAFLAAARAEPGVSVAASAPVAPELSAPHTNLPDDPLPLVGRAAELELLGTLLADPATRVMTIVGPGGMGKTRLAVEAARRHATGAYAPDGVYFVSLVALDDPALLAVPIAEALGFPLHLRDQREHWTRDKQADQLVAYLRDKQMLLVLDNLEHLLSDLSLVSLLVTAAPAVKLLVTSREQLGLRCETVLPLQGLTVRPDANDEARAAPMVGDAVTLFVNAARRAHPSLALSAADFDDIIAICRSVDGMPLGVELAAAWANVLSPAEIAAEIRNNLDTLSSAMRELPERHRSIRAVFDYTWANLSEAERAGVSQLVVFQGGFTREAAQQVAGVTLGTLRSLVQKSLVRPDNAGRYHIHELLRQFASEHLAHAPEQQAAVQERHSAYYVALLARHEQALAGSGQSEALAAIERERYNVAGVWKWAAAQRRTDVLEQAMESLCEFHRIRGNQEEGSALFHIAVSALGYNEPDESALPLGFEETRDLLERPTYSMAMNDQPRMLFGRMLARWCRFHCESPHVDGYTRHNRDAALHHLTETGATLELAYLMRYVGHLGFRPWEVRELYRWALQRFSEKGDTQGAAEVRYRLGLLAAQMGEYQDAERMFRDYLAAMGASGRRTMQANCLLELSYILWALGEYAQAEHYNAEGYAIASAIGYRNTIGVAKRYAARLALIKHDYPKARQQLRESLAIHEEIGLLGMKAEALAEYSHVQLLDGRLAEAAQSAEESLALCTARAHRGGRVEPLIVVGEVACAQGDWLAAGDALREALDIAQEAYLVAYALHALSAVARLFAAVGKLRRALELTTFVHRHPGTWQWTREQLTALTAQTVPGTKASQTLQPRDGLAQSAQHDLWKVVAAVTEELRDA